MSDKHLVAGRIGEAYTVSFLKNLNYTILETNYKNKIGEIDIVAKDKTCLVFIEVKARNTQKFGRPCEAVTYAKQNKIRQVATIYMVQNKCYPCECRFDVAEVFLNKVINYIENAF